MKIAQKHGFFTVCLKQGVKELYPFPFSVAGVELWPSKWRPWVLSTALETEMMDQEADHMHLSVCEIKPYKVSLRGVSTPPLDPGFQPLLGTFQFLQSVACSFLSPHACEFLWTFPSAHLSLFFASPLRLSLTWVVFEYFSLHKAKQIEKSSSLVQSPSLHRALFYVLPLANIYRS